MKVCVKCGAKKPIQEFYFKGNGLRQSRCKDCFKTYGQHHYLKNKTSYQKQAVASRKKRLEWYVSLKDGNCSDCGFKYHPAAMHWDHLPEYKKHKSLSKMIMRDSMQMILEEIKKCELVCANCHAVRSWSRQMEGLAKVVGEV